MFRLKEQQLHILMWLMAGASILLFVFWGIESIPQIEKEKSWKGMEDFSEGWICTYESLDINKVREYQQSKAAEGGAVDKSIVEVLTVPAVLSVREDTVLAMSHQVPDVNMDTLYLTLELDDADVKAFVENELIYESSEKDTMIPVCHMIQILPEYQGKTLIIEVAGHVNETIHVGAIRKGTYNQLWISVLQEHGLSVVVGVLLTGISICMLMVWLIMKNTWYQKRVLLYSALEGFLLGMLCILDGNLLQLVTGWNLGTYLLKSCVIILATVLHLTIIRCFIYKKKVLAIVDTGILIVGVFFISVMVLQALGLLYFDIVFKLGEILFCAVAVIFTIVLAIMIYQYKRREGRPVFVANILLILSIVIQMIMQLMGRTAGLDDLIVCAGLLLYMVYVWIYGMRQAFCVRIKKEDMPMNEEEIRKQVVEQLNPNLIFASFQTLQNLIKSGSSQSVKMIYYISVYLRHNLQVLESVGDVVSFEEELEHIIAYLQLQKTRNQKLDYVIECKVKEFKIPRHSLEPLVENAVKHGIANNGNQGNVAIRTYTRADGYAIQIIDDGVGFNWEAVRKTTTSLTRRLTMLEKVCQARTEVIAKEGKGTVITIVLPMLDNDLMEEVEITEE